MASSALSRQSASVLPPGYSLAGGGIKDQLMSPPGFSAVSVYIPCGLFNTVVDSMLLEMVDI